MSRSRVTRGYPSKTIAMPPMTTKSTPAAVNRRRISRASSAGHSAGILSLGSTGPEGLAAEFPCESVERLESPQPLVRTLPEARRDQALVEPEILIELELDAVTGCRHN